MRSTPDFERLELITIRTEHALAEKPNNQILKDLLWLTLELRQAWLQSFEDELKGEYTMARASITVNESTNEVVIRMPIEESTSKSGKMLLMTSTRGNQETETMYKGKPIYANINLGIYATEKKAE